MTADEVRGLKAEAEEAQAAANAAKAEAEANPADQAKADAAVVANRVASEAWTVWRRAERMIPPISPSDWRVILLGIYLLALLAIGIYVVGLLAMATPPEKATGTVRATCCGADGKNCPSPTPTPTPTSSTESNAKAATNLNAVQTGNANTNSAAPTATTTPTSTPTPTPGSTSDEPQSIPAVVCVGVIGLISADGYLFLIVLFAGLTGATTRLIFSFVRHHGLGDFSMNWAWFYILTPFSGAAVSLFLYCVLRGGFYGSAIGKPLALNAFAFLALGTLSGLFAENAMKKLREVAEVLLAKVPDKSKYSTNGD